MEKKNNYSIGDVNLTYVMETLDATRKGMHQVTITERITTTIPKLCTGSIIEINGAIYEADEDETITGSPSDGIVYIKIVPSGDTASPQFTNIAPEWDDEKQGWYSPTLGEENHRYIQYRMLKSGTNYTYKQFFQNQVFTDGDSLFFGHSTSVQEITDNTGAILSSLSSDYDNRDGWGGTNYVIPEKGIYKLSIFAWYATYSGEDTNFRFGIRVNSSYIGYHETMTDSTHYGNSAWKSGFFEIYASLEAGDIIDFYATNPSAGVESVYITSVKVLIEQIKRIME